MGKDLFVSSDIKAPGEKKLNQHYSDKKLGSFVKNGKTDFRLFAPSALSVKLVTFEEPEEAYGNEFEMTKDEDGVWEVVLDGELYGTFLCREWKI